MPSVAFHRLDLRQVDFVVAGCQRVVVIVQRGLAVRAANRTRDHGLVGVCHQRSPAAFAPQAALARTFTLGLVRAVGLLALRGWHGGVVRRRRRRTEPGLLRRGPSPRGRGGSSFRWSWSVPWLRSCSQPNPTGEPTKGRPPRGHAPLRPTAYAPRAPKAELYQPPQPLTHAGD